MSFTPSLFSYLMVSAAMFSIGLVGVITRRNAIIIFMCIELMLNAVNLSLISFSRFLDQPATGLNGLNPAADGSVFVFFVMCVAAAEAVVGLAIVISLYRNRKDIDVNDFHLFRW